MNSLNNLKKEAQQIRLSEQEKAIMRARIFDEELAPTTLTKSPYVAHYQWFSARFASALAALMIVVLGSGTVYAAQGALPGDALYTVKVKVAEPVREALAFSSEAKVSFHMEVARERLEEAQALAAEGRLSSTVVTQLENNIDTHVREVEVLATQVEVEHPDTAVEISATLESTLSLNSTILETLGDESDDRDTKENSRMLARSAQSRIAYVRTTNEVGAMQPMAFTAPGVESSSQDTFMTKRDVSGEATSPVSAKVAAPQEPLQASASQIRASDQVKKKAEEAIDDMQRVITKTASALGTTTAARITLELETLTQTIKVGGELEVVGDYAGAKDLYTQAYKDATALSAFVRAERRFNKKILGTLLDERFGVRTKEGGQLHIEQRSTFPSRQDDNGEKDNSTTSGRTQDKRDEGGDDRKETEDDSLESTGLPLKLDLGL